MDSGECNKQENTGDSMSSDCDFPKPFWVRYFSLQINVINQRLLDHNAYIICICGPILWGLLYFI